MEIKGHPNNGSLLLKISVSVFAYGSDDQDENGLRLETSQAHSGAVTHNIPLLEELVKGFLSEVRPLRNILTQQKSQWKCFVDPLPPPLVPRWGCNFACTSDGVTWIVTRIGSPAI